MPNSVELEATIVTFKQARTALNAAETALAARKAEEQAAQVAFDALGAGASNVTIGDTVKALVLAQSNTAAADALCKQRRDELAAARAAGFAQAKVDQGL